jgi:transcriptional regulator with XRE-family HTH domain
MAAVQSPTVRRRRLGQELRQLREAAGLTLEDVAERLEWSGAKVSRIETAKVSVRPRDVSDLLDVYGIKEAQHRNNLLALTREARQQGWWAKYSEAISASSPSLHTWVGLEAEAVAIRTYSVEVVNGLLQTEDYAHAILRALWTTEKAEQIDRLVAVRMKRQERLVGEDPLHLCAIVDESV